MRRLLTQEDSEDTKGVVRRRNLKERQLKSANIFNLVEKTLEKAIYIAMLNFHTSLCCQNKRMDIDLYCGELEDTKGGNQKP
jgi:hypothetical protein